MRRGCDGPMAIVQSRRAIQRRLRAMPGGRNFRGARIVLAGVEAIHMTRDAPMPAPEGRRACPAEPCFALAA